MRKEIYTFWLLGRLPLRKINLLSMKNCVCKLTINLNNNYDTVRQEFRWKISHIVELEAYFLQKRLQSISSTSQNIQVEKWRGKKT